MFLFIMVTTLLVISGVVTFFTFRRNRLPEQVKYFWDTRQNQSLYTPEQTGTVLLIFWKIWTDLYSDSNKVFKILNDLDIEWVDKPWDVSLGTVYGECTSRKSIRVWRGLKLNDTYKISRTVLVYQLIHVVLKNLHGDPFYGESSKDYKEWLKKYNELIRTVSEELKSKNL